MSAPVLRPALLCALAVLAGAAAGCGFRLQGRVPLPEPLKLAHVQAEDRQSVFVQGLREALLRAGAQLTPAPGRDAAVVHVLTDEVTERVLSVSARNIPREYELTYTVRFAVSADGQEILPVQEVSASRDFSFDERALLAKEQEEAILREALARDLVGVVMRRLAALPETPPEPQE